MNFVLFLMVVHVQLTAIYVSYLLFSSCYQIFTGDVFAVSKSLLYFADRTCVKS